MKNYGEVTEIINTDPRKSNVEDGLILWSKLGSYEEILKPEVGNGGKALGSWSFAPGKFGNGASAGDLFSYTILDFDLDTYLPKGRIDFWWKPSRDWDNSSASNYPYFIGRKGGESYYLAIWYFWDTNDFGIRVPDSAGTGVTTATYDADTITSLQFSAGEPIHLSLVWDAAGIDGTSDKKRFYFNGVHIDSPTVGADTDAIYSGNLPLQTIFGDVTPTSGNSIDGVMDNLKYYNYAKTDFSGINIEGPEIIEQGIDERTFLKDNNDRGLVFWNRLSSLAEIENSLVGPNGTRTGSTYTSVKFGDGLDARGGNGEYADFTGGSLPPLKGAVEFWYLPDWNSGDVVNAYLFDAPDTTDRILIRHEGTVFRVSVGANYSVSPFVVDQNITSGVPIHLAFAWDNAGINGSTNTIKYYENGEEIGSDTEHWDDNGWTTGNLRIGNSRFNNNRARGAIENVKVFNYAKSDFSDRNEYDAFSERKDTVIKSNYIVETIDDPRLVLWNKLGSLTEVENSEAGFDGIRVGGSYATAKFGEGLQAIANSQYADFNVQLGLKNTVELWYKPAYDNTDTTSRYILDRTVGGTFRFSILHNNSSGGFGIVYPTGGSASVEYVSVSFSTNDLLHLALAWDSSGIEGTSDTVRFYVNGIDVWSTSDALDQTDSSDIRIGNVSGNNAHANGIIDNLKIYNYAKTDYSDINREDTYQVNNLSIDSFEASVEDKESIDFNLYNIYNNNEVGKRKYNSNFSEIKADHSFVRGEQYYLVDYIVHDSSLTSSFVTEVVDGIASPEEGAGATLTGGNINNIELYMLSNRSLITNNFSTDTLSNLKINSSNPVSVSNVNKITIDGLKYDSVFGTEQVLEGVFSSDKYYATPHLVKNNIYIFGGQNSLQKVEKFNVNTDINIGEIGTDILVQNRRNFSSAIYGNIVYLVGDNDAPVRTSVEKFNVYNETSDGELAGILTVERRGSRSSLVGKDIYISGGNSQEQALEKFNVTTEVSTSIGATVLNFGMKYHTSSYYGNYLYLVGGDGDTVANAFKITTFNVANESTAIEIGSDILNYSHYAHAANVVSNELFILGALINSTEDTKVEKLNTANSTVKLMPDMSKKRGRFSCELVKNKLYMVGGFYDSSGTTIGKYNLGLLDEQNPTVISLRFD